MSGALRAVPALAAALVAVLAMIGCQPAPPAALPPVGAAAVEATRAACAARGGSLRELGAGLLFCQRPTGDAGKACTRASDCEGVCLARSRSCAPVAPLAGCNDILTELGQLVRECLQ